jgi:hypothetical protein
MTDDQRVAMNAYVAAYLAFERTDLFTHPPAERYDLRAAVERACDQALMLGVSWEALQEAIALEPWPGHVAKPPTHP